MDRLTAMEVFVQVAKLNSFAAAARALDISTTAVSRYVRQLEDHLGVQLLNRTTRRLTLTEVGAVYFERCIRLLGEFDELDRETRDRHAKPAGTLRVSAPMSFGHRHLLPAMHRFLNQHDGLVLDIRLTDHLVDLIEESVDVALRITHRVDSALVARRLAPCRFAVVAAPDYLGRYGEPREPEELARYNCIIDCNLPTRDRWPFIAEPDVYYVSVRGNLIVSSADAAREAVLAGLGVSLIPTFMVGEDIAADRLVSLFQGRIGIKTTAYAVYPENRYLTARVRVFVDFLRELFGDPPYWDRYL